MTTNKPVLKYCFGLSCKLHTERIGELADGIRYHIQYGNHVHDGSKVVDVTTNDEKFEKAWAAKLPSLGVVALKERLTEALRRDEKFADRVKDMPPEFSKDEVSRAIETLKSAAQPKQLRTVLRAIRQLKLASPIPELPALDWYGLTGHVLSGADLAVVRKDGVAVFDAHLTIQALDGFRIHGVFSGTVDFGPDAYDRFTSYQGPKRLGAKHPVTLAGRFEAAVAPPEFAARRYQDLAIGRWKYERLGKAQFVAAGEVTLKDEMYYPASEIEFDVYELSVVP